MGSVDAAPTDLETVRRILREHAPELEVRAFGSRVSWTARETSDLDLALMTNEPLDAARMAVLRSAFTDSRLPFRVDVVDWAGVSDSFRKVIESEYVTLVGRGERRSGEGWTTMTLSRFSPLTYGKGLKSDVRNSSGHVPVFGSNGQVGWHDKALTDGPTVIVGRKGTVGSVHYSPEPCWPIDTTFFISDGDTELMRFKYYALSALDLETMNMDSAVPGLNRNAFHAREIRTPPLPEQRAIARVLGTLDDKIELNRRMNETLEAMARALFKSWFVDFAPVRAKAEGRDTGLPDHIADQFPDRLVDSELGEIPEGWRSGIIDDIASLNPQSWNTRNIPETVVYVDLSNTKWGCIERVDVHPWGTAPSRARRVLRPGDTIVGTVRPGNGSFALIGRDGLTGSTGFAVLRPKTSHDREIVWCTVTSRDNIERLTHLADGGAYPAVRSQVVAETPVVLADVPVRRAFSSMTAPWFDLIENNRRESQRLVSLRDALLPRLVSGELRLGEAVERLESTA